ncbi:MAG: response regulator [Thiobacillaceae bacterium]|jgi:two-component system chemotaxis response regulator CheY|nr:response regulator [Thiobacillaceae bacterium]
MELDATTKASKILIVDDQDSIREITRALLKEMGFFRIALAEDGAEALAKLQRMPFDLVICDMNMPRMSGLEVLRAARAIPHLRRVKFLMLTANSDPDSVKGAVQAGISGYVLKPFQPATLADKILQVLTRRD